MSDAIMDCFRDRSFKDVIDAADNVPLDCDFKSYYRLLLPNDSRPHGLITASNVSRIPWTNDFVVDHVARSVQLHIPADAADPKSAIASANLALQAVADGMVAAGSEFPSVIGRHSELFRLIGANYPETGGVVGLERFVTPLFGIGSRGAHMTGYVRDPTAPGGLRVWVPRRSGHLFSYPGLLDTTVAGGVKASHSPFECIVAEAHEEASLPEAFVRADTRATGAVTYVSQDAADGSLCPTVLYVYDLEMPADMVPTPGDDEVERFELMEVGPIVAAMHDGQFKPNCVLVMLDFFIRHGILTEDNCPEYVEILIRLRRTLPIATRPEVQ